MREYKFRVFSTQREPKMIYLKTFTSGDLQEEENWKVMQWVGLKDSKGTDIYEGDIIRMHPNDSPQWDRKIKWMTAGWWCSQIRGTATFPLAFENYSKSRLWQVVGNIYENPELLQ